MYHIVNVLIEWWFRFLIGKKMDFSPLNICRNILIIAADGQYYSNTVVPVLTSFYALVV